MDEYDFFAPAMKIYRWGPSYYENYHARKGGIAAFLIAPS